jgi:hypothetical protein
MSHPANTPSARAQTERSGMDQRGVIPSPARLFRRWPVHGSGEMEAVNTLHSGPLEGILSCLSSARGIQTVNVAPLFKALCTSMWPE